MGDSKKLRSRKEKEFAKNPFCIFCGVKMILPPHESKLKFKPDNLCTTEHLFSRNNPLRRLKTKEKRLAICCSKCNHERNEAELLLLKNQEELLLKLKVVSKDNLNGERFYMNYVDGAGSPTVKFQDEGEVNKEAERLCKITGRNVFILSATKLLQLENNI